MMTRERGGGVWIPPKSGDVIYEKPLADAGSSRAAAEYIAMVGNWWVWVLKYNYKALLPL